jgi:glycosyltransferase involved in cell wall biosynthesis
MPSLAAAREVSVIITTFHREAWLLEAIRSALAQRDVHSEIIVVDDSPENSAKSAVESVQDASIRYVPRPIPSQGHPGVVRNDAVLLARAPFVHFLDDDDRLADGALATLARALKVSRAGMAFGRIVPFGQEPDLGEQKKYFLHTDKLARRIHGRRWFAAQLMFADSVLVNSACMVRRDVFLAAGGYDAGLRCCEDVELYLRIGRAFGAVYVDEDVLHYRVGAPSIMKEIRCASGRHPFVRDAYVTMGQRYRATYGTVEFRALQVLAMAARRIHLS